MAKTKEMSGEVELRRSKRNLQNVEKPFEFKNNDAKLRRSERNTVQNVNVSFINFVMIHTS